MTITEVRIFPCRNEKLKAYAAITFDSSFVVRDLKLIQGKKGMFLLMPSRKMKDGSYRDIAHPINNETRSMVEKAVFAEYDRLIENGELESTSGANEPVNFTAEE